MKKVVIYAAAAAGMLVALIILAVASIFSFGAMGLTWLAETFMSDDIT
jgi:hypothetical protein